MGQPSIHPSSIVDTGVTIAKSAKIGPNCYLSGKISIGSDVVLVGGITLVGNATIGDGCVIEPGVTMSGLLSSGDTPLILNAGVNVGSSSVLARGITIGRSAEIKAATVVSRNVPAFAIVCGNPAVIVGYVKSPPAHRSTSSGAVDSYRSCAVESAVEGVKLVTFPRIRDLRGDLSIGEFERNVPFRPKRYFLVYDVPSAETRGEHAHHECEQFLICVAGSVSILVDDGSRREEFHLDAPTLGLYIPPRIWALQYKYSSSAVLLVFASHYYDAADYIRDYDLFVIDRGARG